MANSFTLTSIDNLASAPTVDPYSGTPSGTSYDDEYRLANSYDSSLDTTTITFDSSFEEFDVVRAGDYPVDSSFANIYDGPDGQTNTANDLQTATVNIDGVEYTDVPIVLDQRSAATWAGSDPDTSELNSPYDFDMAAVYGRINGDWQILGYVSNGLSIEDATELAPGANAGSNNFVNTAEFTSENTITETVECFTVDMMIETSTGEVRAGDIKVGDMIKTFDGGFKPVRFVKSTRVFGAGEFAPVIFEKGSIGNNATITVSQGHNFYTGTLDKSVLPERTEGYSDHLVNAVTLVNGSTIRISQEKKFVTYVHIMLDAHELLFCHGTVSESWHPLRRNLRRYKSDPKTRAELLRLFPEINHNGPHNTPIVRDFAVNYHYQVKIANDKRMI